MDIVKSSPGVPYVFFNFISQFHHLAEVSDFFFRITRRRLKVTLIFILVCVSQFFRPFFRIGFLLGSICDFDITSPLFDQLRIVNFVFVRFLCEIGQSAMMSTLSLIMSSKVRSPSLILCSIPNSESSASSPYSLKTLACSFFKCSKSLISSSV